MTTFHNCFCFIYIIANRKFFSTIRTYSLFHDSPHIIISSPQDSYKNTKRGTAISDI